MSIDANIYIACHERVEAAEAYNDRLSPEQKTALLESETDFWLIIKDGKSQLLAIEDEG